MQSKSICAELGIKPSKSKNKSQQKCAGDIILVEKELKEAPSSITLRFIDLFCGIGGFHQAMMRVGGECVFACDIDKDCREIYAKNYGLVPASDITQVNEKLVPDFDVLCAGFPCQSFSNAGKKQSLDDKRGHLFEHILRIANEKRPRWMFLENVKHILKIGEGKVFQHILKRIRETGYYVKEQETVFELRPHQLGIPQHRERVIFVCIRQDIYDANISLQLELPILSEKKEDVKERMDAILVKELDMDLSKYKIPQEFENILSAWNEMVEIIDVGESLSPTLLCNEFLNEPDSSMPNWKQEYMTKNKPIFNKYKEKWMEWLEKHKGLISKKEIYGKLEWQVGKKKEGDSIWNYFIQFRQSGIRVKKCDYFPALVAIVQTPIYAKERRYICPRECARLQSFPDKFIMHETDKVAYKQFGNAVNVDVVHFVIRNSLQKYGFIL